MAMSGIEIDDEVTTIYNDMKLRSTHKWAIFKVSNDMRRLEIEKKGDPVSTEDKEADKVCFMELAAQFDEPRYALYDFRFENKQKRMLHKLAFIVWIPDESKIKLKMRYASSKDTIKKAFTGVPFEFQFYDRGDIDYDSLAEEIERKS